MKALNNSLFLSPVLFYLCTSESQFRKLLKSLKCTDTPPFLSEFAHATTHILQNGNDVCCVVCLGDRRMSKEATYALLVHEAVHIWQEIKKVIVEANPSSEFEAYAIQNISQTLFRALR